jgi:cellobiose-specific phosphotransferase system component IIC
MIVMIVGAIVSTLDSSTFDDPTYDPFMSEDPTMIAIGIVGQITGIGFHILAIYLVYTWSKQWNKQFQTSESDF